MQRDRIRPILLASFVALFGCGENGDQELCGDLIDNDGDGRVDCLDTGCIHQGGCDFAPCIDGNDCQGTLCLTEQDNGFPAGACSSFCELSAPVCPFGPDSECVDIGLNDGRGICVDTCTNSTQCREDLNCRDGNVGVPICLPNCQDDIDCPITDQCNQDNGFCESSPEICNNIEDDDQDSRSDCEDSDCQGSPFCDPVLACQDAPAIGLGTISDDTSDGTNIFVGSCAGNTAREKLFTFTPSIKAALRVTLESPSVHGVYSFANCAFTFEGGCATNFVQDPNALIIPEANVTIGVPLLLVVDGFLTGQEGPFSLTIEEVAPESNCEDLLDDDFDGKVDCQDEACQTSCTPGSGALGAPCTAPSDCQLVADVPACFDEIFQGFPSGYCTGFCTVDAECGPGNSCQNGLCFQGCVDGTDCTTPGYECQTFAGDKICVPVCTVDAQCPEAGFCNADTGRCRQVTEDCSNFVDDDDDNLEDCQDLSCQQTVPACDEALNCSDGLDNDADQLIDCEDVAACGASPSCQLSALCAAATPITGDTNGDTTNSSQQFSGSCTGANLAHETLFLFTPGIAGQTGSLVLSLDSATDQGMYVRSVCDDPSTELDCEDLRAGGVTENMAINNVPGGVPLTIFVDGFQSANEDGPFTLRVSYAAQ